MNITNRIIVSIEEASKIIVNTIAESFAKKEIPLNIALEGSPGIGKSAIIKNAKYEIAKKLGISPSEVGVIDIRLAGMDAADVLGIPFVNHSESEVGKEMKFSTPEWWPQGGDGKKYYILFLDELPNASKAVQQAAYRLILDRSIQNGRVLPDSCAIISAGNRPEDNTGAKKMLPAAANRFGMILSIDGIEEGFINYITRERWDMTLVSFLSSPSYRKYIVQKPNEVESAFSTPRSLEAVNRIRRSDFFMKSENDVLRHKAIASAVGVEVAQQFSAFEKYEKDLPDWKRLMTDADYGKTFEISDEQHIMFALTTSTAMTLGSALREKDSAKQKVYVSNILNLVTRFEQPQKVVFAQTLKRDTGAIAKALQFESINNILDSVGETIKNLTK